MNPTQAENQRSRTELKRMARALETAIIEDTFISAMVDAHNNAESRIRFSTDKRTFLKERRCNIPNNLKLEFVDADIPALKLMAHGDGLLVGVGILGSKEPLVPSKSNIARYKKKVRELTRFSVSEPMLDVVEEALSDEQQQRNFNADPKAHLSGRGISIPERTKFKVRVEKGSTTIYWVMQYCYGCTCFSVTYCWSDDPNWPLKFGDINLPIIV